MLRFAAIALLAGCSSILGIEDLGGPAGTPDGGGGNDTPDPPGQVRISGALRLRDKVDNTQPFPNAIMDLVVSGNGVTSSTSSTNMGTYAFDVDTRGQVLDAFIHVFAVPAVRECESFLPPIMDDLAVDVFSFTDNFANEVGAMSGEPQDPSRGFLQIVVVDELGRPVPEVQFLSTFSNRIIYADDTGRPAPAVFNRTTTSGLAWVMNVPPGNHAIESNRNGQPLGQRQFTGKLSMNGEPIYTNITLVVPSGIMP